MKTGGKSSKGLIYGQEFIYIYITYTCTYTQTKYVNLLSRLDVFSRRYLSWECQMYTLLNCAFKSSTQGYTKVHVKGQAV